MNRLVEYFEIEQRGSSVGHEFRGAVATFLTMAYILIANPAILSGAGVPVGSAISCTALAAGICCLLMGFVGRFPLALASGMGLNAFIVHAAAVTGSWQTAMALVFLDGLIILILVSIGLREAMLDAIPADLRRGIGAGIGLFIALIGAVNSGIVTRGSIPGPPVAPGEFTEPTVLIALASVAITAMLLSRRVPGSILIGIAIAAVALRAVANDAEPINASQLLNLPSFETVGALDLKSLLIIDSWKTLLPLLVTLLIVDFFDTLGTVTSLGEQSGLLDDQHRAIGLRKILYIDSISASIGGFLGVSSVTSYIESAAGIAEGARTGLHSVFVGIFFLLCVFTAPLVALVPATATASTLIVVGFLMAGSITRIDFKQVDTAIPAFVTLLLIPMTYSISHGIGYGILTFVAIRIFSFRFREVHILMYAAAAVFTAAFAFGE